MRKNYPTLYYSDYLKLDALLSIQNPKSKEYTGELAHDEVLFITVHQVYELWFKQILHELDSVRAIFARDYIDEKNIGVAVSELERITEIQKLLIEQLRVLETMTPLDFLEFRDYLFPASGFQSWQFRLIENKLGLLPERRVSFDKHAYFAHLTPEHQEKIKQCEQQPSLLELVEKWLERTPFLEFQGFNFWTSYRTSVERILQEDEDSIKGNALLTQDEQKEHLGELQLNRANFAALFNEDKHNALVNKGKRRLSYKATQAALLINLYRDEPILHMPFKLLTVLIDIDELLTAWRYRHALMVHRMIGTKVGTGGSSGHHYLTKTAESHSIFSDFANLSTYLIPRSELPLLPAEVERKLDFYYAKGQ